MPSAQQSQHNALMMSTEGPDPKSSADMSERIEKMRGEIEAGSRGGAQPRLAKDGSQAEALEQSTTGPEPGDTNDC
ncbi:hypothetical protein EG329_008253 [Mollisiaceae sp. DMI_Dod_QoI]|nr:hypothetical protein EG329_008253 [Helotiales sp. DMI_Dod_QoI]